MSNPPSSLVVRSPGRVNLIGEHTDYNDGWVLPLAIDRGTTIAARRRDDGRLAVTSARLGESDDAPLDNLGAAGSEGWRAYVRGTAQALRDAGVALIGADLTIDSDLPLGGGLSSSASLEIGVATALLRLAGATMETTKLALLAQQVEHQYAHVNCGIMDQLSIAAGRAGFATLIDCRSLAIEAISLPGDVEVLIVDSGVPRTLAGSAYNQRRAECDRAVAALQAVDPGVRALRDVTDGVLIEAIERDLLDDVAYRRARHVVSENERTLAVARALQGRDYAYAGELMNESHWSMRDDYEISGPELDTLTDLLREQPGVFGARLTGAGFGGCVVALVEQSRGQAVAEAILPAYREATGRAAEAFTTRASQITIS